MNDYATNEALPDWIKEWMQVCIRALGISHYKIQAYLVDNPDGGGQAACVVELDETYRRAMVKIGRFVENDSAGRQYILHEMLHIAFSPVDRLFQLTQPLLPKNERKVFNQRANDAQEQSVETVARALVKVLEKELE